MPVSVHSVPVADCLPLAKDLKVWRCRMLVSKPILRAPMVSDSETTI
jgi:hypothetical protein